MRVEDDVDHDDVGTVLFGLALARGVLVVAGSRIATRRTVGF